MRRGIGHGGKICVLLVLLVFTVPGCADVKRALGMAEDDNDSLLYLSLALLSTGGIHCPDGFIPVPANPDNGITNDFCVAKYEMKNDGGSAASRAAGIPWSAISRNSAVTACQDLGSGYDLIDNARWQTIARSIENVASNWSGGVVGLGVLPNGFSDNVENPTECSSSPPCPASTDDQNGYFGTNNDAEEPWGGGAEQKRTLTLSNGQVIWDFAGDLAEWVKDNFTVDYAGTYGVSDGYISQLTQPDVKALFGPRGDYNYLIHGGLGYANFSVTNVGAYRGGDWSMGDSAGIFTFYQSYAPDSADSGGGFRCIWSE